MLELLCDGHNAGSCFGEDSTVDFEQARLLLPKASSVVIALASRAFEEFACIDSAQS